MKFSMMIIILTSVAFQVRAAEAEISRALLLHNEAPVDFQTVRSGDVVQSLEVRTPDGGETMHSTLTEKRYNVPGGAITTKVVEKFPDCTTWTMTHDPRGDAYGIFSEYVVTKVHARSSGYPAGRVDDPVTYNYVQYLQESKREALRQQKRIEETDAQAKKEGSCWSNYSPPSLNSTPTTSSSAAAKINPSSVRR